MKIQDLEIKENFSKFLKVLETVIEKIEDKKLDSKSLIKTILGDEELCCGIELTLHNICTAAAKVSVESVVESLVSRYEGHFDARRELKEEHALDEMEISENVPNLPNADKILLSAMNK